jgi:hypothetical protein
MTSLELLRPLIVFAYLLAAAFCGSCALRWEKPARGAWIGMMILLTLLGLSKRWNLIPQWAQSIRDAAWLQGWYGLRQIFQSVFIAVVILFLIAWFLAVLRNSAWQLWLPISATTLLIALSIIRAVSLHAIDLFLYQELSPGVQPNSLIELGAILLVGGSAIIAFFWPAKPNTAAV